MRSGLTHTFVVLLSWVMLIGVGGHVYAATLHPKGQVFSPVPGVICDSRGGFCADTEGVALALTKLYLGEAAEKRLMDMIRSGPGVQNFDATTFVLTNKVTCDCKAKVCKVSKYDDKVDVKHTQWLFGQ